MPELSPPNVIPGAAVTRAAPPPSAPPPPQAPAAPRHPPPPPRPELPRRSPPRGPAVPGPAPPAPAAPATKALAAPGNPPAARKGGDGHPHGDLRDIKHIVVLMQENRSFDHYYGSLAGVIGFGDRSAITLPGGSSVWQQPITAPSLPVGGTQYPWPLSNGAFAGA